MKTLHQNQRKMRKKHTIPTSCMILKILVMVKNYSKENYWKERKPVCQSPVARLSIEKKMNECTYNCSKLWVVKGYISFSKNWISE